MATVHFGRLLGPVGFSRTVAIKRLHPQYAKDPDFVSMFLDEARLAARVQHPNVVSTLDVVALGDELFLVLEYVEGEALARLLRACRTAGTRLPPRAAATIITGSLYGLHAAHEAKNERGEPLQLVHRDVSPQNLLVGVDGVTRVLDFGIAKAVGRAQVTREGQIKGKLSYMPPEQINGADVDRRADVYAAGVVLWEALTAQRLFEGENDGQVLSKILKSDIPKPSLVIPDLPPTVDAIVLKSMHKDPNKRFGTAWEMAVALEEALGVETPRRVGEIVHDIADEAIARRSARRKQLESYQDLSAMVTASSVLAAPHPNAPTPIDPGRDEKTIKRKPPRSILLALAIMAGLGAATALALVAFVEWQKSSQGAEAAPNPTVGPATPPAASAAELAPPKDVTPEASPPPAPSHSPSQIASTPLPTATVAPTAVPPVRPPPVATTSQKTTTPPPAKDCEPPYVIVDGIRKLKPQCI
ncbi:MAG: serine/threonine protein kinase [Polyangiaceae bacterium]|nr:serine/threonine protein kinase [Polyangiaceae bacterium]